MFEFKLSLEFIIYKKLKIKLNKIINPNQIGYIH